MTAAEWFAFGYCELRVTYDEGVVSDLLGDGWEILETAMTTRAADWVLVYLLGRKTMMTLNPIERYRRLKGAVEAIVQRTDEIDSSVQEISNDPFTSRPSETMIEVHEAAVNIRNLALKTLDTLKALGATHGFESNAERVNVGTVVDESVNNETTTGTTPGTI